jgi:Peptidase inhibitor family I36
MTKNTLVVFAIGLSSLYGATAASAQARWGRERMPQRGACFYEDRNFGGRYFCVRPGEDLRSLPSGMGDRVSSIRLLGASEVTVFKDSDMRGRSAFFARDVSDLRSGGWNDQISSVAVSTSNTGAYGDNGYYGNDRARARNRGYPNDRNSPGWNPDTGGRWPQDGIARNGACFYQDTNYRGESFCVARGATYTSLPSGFNDHIGSIRVFGSGVELFEDRNFRGRSTEVSRDVTNLRGDWRNTVSSVRVF